MSNGRLKILILVQSPSIVRTVVPGLHMHDIVIESDTLEACARLERGDRFDVVLCESTTPAKSAGTLLAAAWSLSDPPIVVQMSRGKAIGGGTVLNEIDRRVQAKARVSTRQIAIVTEG